MFQLRRLALGAAAALALSRDTRGGRDAGGHAWSWRIQIDDMITLDPAEVFEFTGAEYAANVYDRLVTYPARRRRGPARPRRRELADRRRRQDLHVQGHATASPSTAAIR